MLKPAEAMYPYSFFVVDGPNTILTLQVVLTTSFQANLNKMRMISCMLDRHLHVLCMYH